MTNRPNRERKHRLPREDYIGRRSVAFTACLRDRKPKLNDPTIVPALVSLLGRSADSFGCCVPIYTFMPDHMHVLLIGERVDSDLKGAMDKFKYLSGFWLFRHRPDLHWQKDYWDHVVREFEGWRTQARYIAANPCRAGLCHDIFDWPYTGSIGFDLHDVLADAFW